MAWTFELRWGTRTLNLDSAPFAVKDFNIRLAEPDVIEHVPDFGARSVTRLLPTDRAVTLRMQVSAASAALVADALTDLKLLVDGPNQIAADTDQATVYFAFDRNGGNGVMLHPVKFGNVSDSYSHFRTPASANNAAIDIEVTLICEEAGEAATAITLKNYLVNADFSIGGGTATAWNSAGSATFTQTSSVYLINDLSQRVQGSADLAGLFSDTVAAGTAEIYSAAGLWVLPTQGTVRVALQEYQTAGSAWANLGTALVTISDALGASDKQTKDASGNTWYHVSLAGSATVAGHDFRLRAEQAGAGSANWWMDAAYLTIGTAAVTAPTAWSSYYKILNRGDRSTTNPTYLNWVYVWGVPGDMPAYLRVVNVPGSTQPMQYEYWGATSDSYKSAASQTLWVDSADSQIAYTETGSGSWGTDAADVTKIGGSYRRFTPGANNDVAIVTYTPTNRAEAIEFFQSPRRVFVVAVANRTDQTTYAEDFDGIRLGDTFTPGLGAVELMDLGIINRTGTYARWQYDDTEEANRGKVVVKTTFATGAGGTVWDFDGFFFMPVRDQHMIVEYNASSEDAPDWLAFDGKYQDVQKMVEADTIDDVPEWVGSFWYVKPGNIVNRLAHIATTAIPDTGITYGYDYSLTLTVTPRARLLLGSQRNV